MTTLKQRAGQLLFRRLPVTRFLFDQVRTEMNALAADIANRIAPGRRAIVAALRDQRDVYVNVASGPFALPGFVNIDLFPSAPGVVQWDCRWSLPVGDQHMAGGRAEHFVEHLEPREELPAFLADVLRALKPGAVFRIVVPDAELYLRAYCSGRREDFMRLGMDGQWPADLPTPMDVVNHVFHQWHEHRWGYDYANLADRLTTAGFSQVRRMSFRTSLDPRLAEDREQHAPYSLYVDAVK